MTKPFMLCAMIAMGGLGVVLALGNAAHAAEALIALERKAADGDVDAQRDLGLAFLFGKYGEPDGGQAKRWLLAAAKQQDAPAQAALGYVLETGVGGDGTDVAQAVTWYEQAARQNHPVAQGRLGLIYLRDGPMRDYAAAAKWLAKAAAWGDQQAQLAMAELYEEGRGVPRDDALAATWYSAAAAQKNVLAQWRLGRLYELGRGVSRDYVKAYMWYSIAGVWDLDADGSVPESDPRHALAQKMERVDIEHAETLAAQWWEDHFQPAAS